MLLRSSIVLSLALLVAACAASGPKIISDWDRSVNPGGYKTYDFFPNAGPRSGNYQSFFSQYMERAISREMEARGFRRSSNPDLLVNFNAILRDKTKVTTTPASGPAFGGYYGYRRGYYQPWVGYGYGTETHVRQYTEGTFNIDLVDARQQKLVWEAIGVGKVTDDVLENLEQRVNKNVPKFFADFPFRAD